MFDEFSLFFYDARNGRMRSVEIFTNLLVCPTFFVLRNYDHFIIQGYCPQFFFCKITCLITKIIIKYAQSINNKT